MKPARALFPVVAIGAAASCASNSSPASQPNIILIVADDLGLGDVSCYGSTTISTPNIDRLAVEGLRMNNAYATSSTSTPSRFGLFTGMYPWRTPEARILPGDAPLLIDPSTPTLPKMMQELGYSTAAVGKWHLGMGYGKTDWNKQIDPPGNSVGFDYTNLIPATVDRVPTVYVENGKVLGLNDDDPILVDYDNNFPGEPTALTNPEMMEVEWHHGHQGTIVNGIPRIGFMKGGQEARWKDDEMADYFLSKAKNFIIGQKDNPFFLYYGLHQPHVPRVPNERFEGSSGLGPRGDSVVEADWCVGQLVECLDSLGLLDNTLIIFTSDNGAVLQDGYKDEAVELAEKMGHDPDNGLRGGKYSLFDAGTHIPFIVYWKNHVKPAVSTAWFCQMDLYSTLGEYLGGKVANGLDSVSYVDVLFGNSLSGGREIQILEAQGRLALRHGDFVYIPAYKGEKINEALVELGCNEKETLWNLSEDPFQQKDLSVEFPDVLKNMREEFLGIVGSSYNPGFEAEPLQ
ncbi:MAG: sulfatase-like hydrolase/transferase [Bacteroidales bacterium]|nr:sulfatase-like hydrolase/transferase [Bacteroidales bacterium]